MSSLEKRHTGQRGSMQGHHKYSDGFSDTSSSGSFMDDTDREVSNLTDRAFRSLCIGEEAIYNDSEFSSSPTERQKAFAEVNQQRTVSQETLSYSIQQYGETETQPELASTFQHSYVDVTHQEQAFKEGSLSYLNNGTREVMWEQGRSSSRVSSLIKAFSSGECYRESGTLCDVILAKDNYKDCEPWDKSALLSMQRELSEFSSGYHQNFKSGSFQSYRNNFYKSNVATAVAQMDTTVLMKTSKNKFKALNSTNCFFHSEFSPFQLWEDYNRFPFESSDVSGFMSTSEFPRWYDSPMYKELKDNHRIPNSVFESRRFNQRQIQDVVASQRSRSTVTQKASAIEKRCESEMASNYPTWKKNNNFVRNKLPGFRPSTVSPTYDRTCRPDSSLFSNNKVTHEIVVESTLPSSVTPFNITQLLTPVIHTRQETETSEILQFAHTPSVSDYSSQGETDPKLQGEVKHLRDSYKSKASSLLFNLKDNRKRVKSTYSPTRFKGLEITDRNKQTSKLEGRESRFSDMLLSQEMAQENLIGTDAQGSSNLTREPSAASITLKDYNTDDFGSYDNLTLTPPQNQDGVANYKSFHGSSEGHTPSTDPLVNFGLSTHNFSAQDRQSFASEHQLKDLHRTFSPARPEITKMHPKAYPLTHSLPAQTLEQYGSDNVSQNDLKQRKDFGRKTFIEYNQNEVVKESFPWEQIGSVKETDSRSESRPFRGEIATLIEMDKQRKATAKQYSANDSYSVTKETYMQKVNEDIKLGRLSKEGEIELREDTIWTGKTLNSENSQHNNQMNIFSKHAESCIIPENILQNKGSPLKEAYGGLQTFNVKNELVKEVPQQNAYLNTLSTQKTYDQRAHAHLQDHRCQKNEGLYSYQPYKYEPNKQWHMASASEDRHIKESIWTQKQSEVMEQTNAKSYKISNLQMNQNEFFTSNGAPNPGNTSDQNNKTKQEDRFSINDILAVRDHEQALRLKDNTFVLAKSENSQNQVKYDMADKQTITQPVQEQEQQALKVHDVTSPSPGYIRKDFHNTNEANINNDRKDKIMSKDTDKVATRVLSYKEKGQSKQEILTSKLKAHAQKEISAIKEKGLAKQGILARSATKASGNNDGQESPSVKKEITADKLNHLFQDITYSSVTQYKDQNKMHTDYAKNDSPTSMKKQFLNFEDNQNSVLEMKIENVKCKLLATERQNDKHPAEYKGLMTEMFIQEEGAEEADMRNNVQKYSQPSRISEDQQKYTASEKINNNKQSSKRIHEFSPSELMSGHLAATVTTENYTSHNPPPLHDEKQTDATKKDLLHGTSTEPKISNSSLNKHSLFELEGNTSTAHTPLQDKRIIAVMDQSKNEPIKNSYGITASQLTSSSSDIKFKNGIPSAKRRMEPAKSELSSNLQTNTLSADAEQLINRTYKNNSGVTSDTEASSKGIAARVNPVQTNNSTSQRPMVPETLKNVNENGQASIIKNTTKENMAKKESDTSQVKAEETIVTNQMLGSQSKSRRNEESLTKESSQLKELHQDDKNTKTTKDYSKAVNISQQGEKRTESANLKQNKEQEFSQPLGTSNEKNNQRSATESTVKQNNIDKQTNDLEPNIPSQHKVIVDEGATQKNNTQPILTKNSESTEEISNITTLTPSKENTAEEPMIYSICVSSKSEAASDDEPMIYTICVSSKCHTDEQPNPVKQEEKSSVETENCVTDERFGIKNDRAETERDDFHRQTEVSSNREEKEDKIGKPELQSTLDKSIENSIVKITTSYEDLLVKYGLPVRDSSHLTSKHKQDERKRKEKEEAETKLSQKPIKHVIKSPQEFKGKSSKNTQICFDDSRQGSDQQAYFTSQPLKETESKIKHVQHYDTSCSKDMAEKQQSTGNKSPRLCPSTINATRIPDDTEEADQDNHNIKPSKQRRGNSIISKEKKVEEQVKNNEKVESMRMTGNITDDVSICRKSPEKADRVSLTTKQSAIGESTRAAEVLNATTSNASMAKDTTKTEVTENNPRRTIPQIEKKPDEVKFEGMKMTANINDDESICRKSPEKTDHVSLTTKKSAVGQAEVNVSMAKDTADTKLTENKIPRRAISQTNMKMTVNITDNVSICRKSPEKTDHVSLTTKQSAVGESARQTEVLKAPTLNASMAKDTANTKLTENKIPRRTIPQIEKKLEGVEGEDKIIHSDSITPQKNKLHERETQKITHEAKQEDSIIKLQPVSDKDSETMQNNRKGNLGDKMSQEKLQVQLNKGHEIANRMKMVSKDGCATHVNNYKEKVSSIGEDVCAVVKQDQAPFEAPKIHLKDIKVSTEEVSSSKEFMVGHKKQHEVIKRENQKGKKETVMTERVGEKDFTEQKKLPVETLTAQKEPKTMNNVKGTCESGPKYVDGKEISPLKKDGPSESEKRKMNPRQGVVWTEKKQPALNSDNRKKEEFVLSLNEQNDGDLKVNENRSRGKEVRHVEVTETKQIDQINTNQYQTEKSFVPETKISARHEQEPAKLSQQDMRKEGILSKSEATQKKVTRPEISAIADYARLKVISAEDDTKDLDIFFYNSHDQSSVRIPKGSSGDVSKMGEESKKEVISREKGQNLKQTTSFKKTTDKEMLPQKHNPSPISTAEAKPLSSATSGSQDGAASMGTKPRALNQKVSNTKQTIMEQPNREESNKESNKMYRPKNTQGANLGPLQAENTLRSSKQLTYDSITEKDRLSYSGRKESPAHLPLSGTIKPADNQMNVASPRDEMEELQYYTVNALDSELKPNKTPETPPSLKTSQNKDPAEKSEEEKKEDSLFLQSLNDYGKVHATGPRSNSSSPAMGKPTMFRVKDNTMRASSVTKAVKPRFHRSFSDDFRIGSPKDHLGDSEKEDEVHPKESSNTPVLHEPAIAAAQLHKIKETLNDLSSAENTSKQSKIHHRRSQNFEEEETCSVISTMSEDMEKCTARSTCANDISLAFIPRNESYRNTYQRPASACYERPESVCYERPESACSDIRSLGRPPAVPPKSEKALRRAQRLTTRRMMKAETPKIARENQEQLESQSISNISDLPSAPSDVLTTHPVVQTTPALSQYDIQPNYTPPSHNIVAQPFPLTQRKLLQDPNSGQYFMVDVPLPVKTKTFFDPETGKYVQLNVRQRSQGTLTQPASVEMLNAPYMLYRGFLPMTASSLPSMRSSSEISPLAGLTINQNTLEAGSEQWRQNVHLQNHSRDSQQYPEILYRSHEDIHNPALYAENNVNNDGRHTDIITMSELEDFAMEST